MRTLAIFAAHTALPMATAAPQPASAQGLERIEIEARTLLVEALRSYERAMGTDDPIERLKALQTTERVLARIEDEFAISDTGIKLLTGESFGQLVPSMLPSQLRAAREVVGDLSDSDFMATFVVDCTQGLAAQAPIPEAEVAELCGCIFETVEQDIPIDRLVLIGRLFDRNVPEMAEALVSFGLSPTAANQTTNIVEGAAEACFAARQAR